MSDDLVKRWDDYVGSMGCVMGEVENMAQQMRDRTEDLEAENARLREALGKALERLEVSAFTNSEHAQAAEILRAALQGND